MHRHTAGIDGFGLARSLRYRNVIQISDTELYASIVCLKIRLRILLGAKNGRIAMQRNAFFVFYRYTVIIKIITYKNNKMCILK